MAITDHIKDKRSPFQKAIGGAEIPHKVVDDFVGAGERFKGTPVAVRTLPADVIMRADAAAVHACLALGYTTEMLYTEAGEDALAFERKVQTLAKACVDPADPSRPFFASADEARLLEPDEAHVLYNHFVAWQEERSPLSRANTWQEVEDQLMALGKGLIPRSWLNSFDASSLRFMCCGLADRLATLTSPSSPPTSPSSEPDPSSASSSG